MYKFSLIRRESVLCMQSYRQHGQQSLCEIFNRLFTLGLYFVASFNPQLCMAWPTRFCSIRMVTHNNSLH